MWKLIADEMPPENVPVLLYGVNSLYKTQTQAVGYWDMCGSKPYWNAACVSGYEWDFDLTPTHWQPLPEQPTP